MSIIRVKKDKGFFAASNIPFNDVNLSWEARGVLGYLLSKPEDWQVRFYDLIKQGPAGEYKMRRILKELEDNKYLERHLVNKKNEQGKFDWISIVYETPTIPRLSVDGLPTDGSSADGSPTDGKPRDIDSTDPPSTDPPSTDEGITDETLGRWCSIYESEIGGLTGMIGEEIGLLISEYPEDWFEDAVRIAVENNKRKLSYVKGILSNWKIEGKDNGYKPRGKKKGVDEDMYERVAKELENE